MLNSLIDSIREIEQRIRGLKINAQKLKNDAAIFYLDIRSTYFEYALETVSIFTREEMIFIIEMRHQYVHGRLDESHKQNRMCKYIKNKMLVSEKIKSDQYWNKYRKILNENDSNVDTALEKLRSKFYSKKTMFWTVDTVFRNLKFLDVMSEDIQNNQISSQISFPKDNKTKLERAMSLYEIRNICNSKAQIRRLDPVTNKH